MRRVVAGRVAAVAMCALVPLFGAPAAQGEPGPVVVATAEMPSAQESSQGNDSASWGLLGLLGLLGLVGLARPRRHQPVASDPLSAYPVMRDWRSSARATPTAARHNAPSTPPRNTPAASPRNRPYPPAPTAYLPSVVPAQNRGDGERSSVRPKPTPPPPPSPTQRTSSDGSATSITQDGSIRLAPAPPLHAERLSEPSLDDIDVSGTTVVPAVEPRWPQREYY